MRKLRVLTVAELPDLVGPASGGEEIGEYLALLKLQDSTPEHTMAAKMEIREILPHCRYTLNADKGTPPPSRKSASDSDGDGDPDGEVALIVQLLF